MSQIQRAQLPGCVGIQMTLASYYSKMKDLTKAEEYLNNALKLDPKNTEVLLLQAKVRKEKQLEQQTKKMKEKLVLPKHGKLKMKDPVKVERCDMSNLTVKEFLEQYSTTGTPVIITGLEQHRTNNPWNIQYIRKIIGHKSAPSNQHPNENSQQPGSVTIATFIDSMHDDKRPPCSTDWSVTSFGPELTKDLIIPRYAADDFLQRTDKDTAYQDAWPCVSIQPAGTSTSMKIEPLGFNCWMALCEGRKRLMLVRKEDTPCLYPYCDDNINVMFHASICKPDLKDFPLLSSITPLECILEPGEYLFIPSGTAYCIETLDDSLTITADYVDLTNLHDVKEELNSIMVTDTKLQDLHRQLTSDTFPTNMCSEQNDFTWEEFKTWPRKS